MWCLVVVGFGKEASETDIRVNKWLGGETEAIKLMNIRIAEEKQVRSEPYNKTLQLFKEPCNTPRTPASTGRAVF